MIRRLSSLPLQILAFVILPLFALLMVVAFGGVAIHQSAMRDMVMEHNLHAVRGAAASFSARLAQQQAILTELAERLAGGAPAGDVLDGADWPAELFDGGISFYAADGELLVGSAEVPAPPLDGSFVPVEPDGRGDVQIALVARAAGEREVTAVGLASFDALGVEALLGSLHPSASSRVAIVTPGGEVVYHSDEVEAGGELTASPYIAAALSGESGADFFTPEDGPEVVASYAPIPAAGWALLQEEQWQATLGPLMRFSLAAPLVLVPGLLIAAVAVWFGLQQVVRPLQRLEDRASDLAWGDYTSVEEPVGGIEEIRQLQGTLRFLAERVQAAQAGMRNYIGAITQTQEDERARLARELHDQTAQSLVAIGHREQMLKRYLRDDPEAEKLLSELRQMTTQTVDDLRRIIRAMRPIYLEELGLVPALNMLAKDLDASVPGLTVEFEQVGETRRLPAEHEMALYRVAQEALSNAWQHSQADRVRLSIGYQAGGVELSVEDDGVGFDAPQRVTDLAEQGHYGIMGMYERAALIGAALRVRSEPGQGTAIVIRASLPPGEDQTTLPAGSE